jgi:hypothetical protein
MALLPSLDMLLMRPAMRMLAAFLTGLGGALRIVLEVSAATLATFALTGMTRAMTFISHDFELLLS